MQTLGNRLLVTPPPQNDESLTGYIVRLTALNRYKAPAWILSMAGIGKSKGTWKWPSFVFSRSKDLKKLGELVGLSLPHLETLIYPPAKATGSPVGSYLFYGSPVPQSMIQPQLTKICPSCLKDSPHCRRIWDFRLVTCCTTHRCRLVDECPNCRKRLKWHRPAASFCSCGFDLQEAHAQPANDAASRLSDILFRLCGISDNPEGGAAGVHNPLAVIKLEQAVAAILFLLSRRIDGNMVGRGMALLSNREIHDILLQTASIFEEWPDRFHVFIESKCSESFHSGTNKRNRQLYWLYRHLSNNARLSSPELDFLRSAFMDYMQLCGKERISRNRTPTLRRRRTPNLKYLSKTEAARRIGAGLISLRHFISEGKLKTVVKEGRMTSRLLVEANSVEKLKGELSQLIDIKKAAKWLGVPFKVIENLTAAGCLMPARGPNIDGCRKLRFKQRDVVNLMKNVTSRLPKCDPLFKICPDFRMAVKRFGPSNANLVSKVKDILDGRLSPLKQSAKTKRFSPKVESLFLPF